MSLPISIGSGATVGTEVIGGAHYGFNKIVGGQSGATIGWQIDTNGIGQVAQVGNVTLTDSKKYIGLVTVTPGTAWPDPVSSIGFVTVGGSVGVSGNVTLADPKGYIGLVSVAQPLMFAGNVTIDSIANPIALKGNVTLSDSKQYIGLVSVSGFQNPLPVTSAGNVTLDPGSKTGITGNVTLSDSKTYIGLVTTTIDTSGVLGTGNQNALFVSTASGTLINVVLRSSLGQSYADSPNGDNASNTRNIITMGRNFIYNGAGWDMIRTANAANATTGLGIFGTGILGFDGTNYRRILTGTDGILQVGLTSISDPKGFIGLVTVGNTVSVLNTGAGNVTLSDPKTFIGSVTVGGYMGWSYAFISTSSGAVVKASAGMLHSIVVGMPSLASCKIYDSTTPASPVLGTLAQGIAPGTYYYDCLFANGLTISLASTAVLPQLTVMYK